MPTNFEHTRLKQNPDIVEKHENRVHRLADSNGTRLVRPLTQIAMGCLFPLSNWIGWNLAVWYCANITYCWFITAINYHALTQFEGFEIHELSWINFTLTHSDYWDVNTKCRFMSQYNTLTMCLRETTNISPCVPALRLRWNKLRKGLS